MERSRWSTAKLKPLLSEKPGFLEVQAAVQVVVAAAVVAGVVDRWWLRVGLWEVVVVVECE